MPRRILHGSLDKGRLRALLLVFFAALTVPGLVLVYQAYSQLQWQAIARYRVMAENLAARVDAQLIEIMEIEEQRSYADYTFLVFAGDPSQSFVQRSPLSQIPAESRLPGLLGYFQVDSGGVFSTPLLPRDMTGPGVYGISEAEYSRRLALQNRIRDILSENSLVRGPTQSVRMLALEEEALEEKDAKLFERFASRADAEPVQSDSVTPGSASALYSQAAFDQLNKAEMADAPAEKRRQVARRKENIAVPATQKALADARLEAEASSPADADANANAGALPGELADDRFEDGSDDISSDLSSAMAGGKVDGMLKAKVAGIVGNAAGEIRITTFEGEIDPFEFSLLDSGHLVLFRKVWRDGQRYTQGAILQQQEFVDGLITGAFRDSSLSRMSELLVSYRGRPLRTVSGAAGDYSSYSNEESIGSLLYQARLAAPLGELAWLLRVTDVPTGTGASLVTWTAFVLAAVLVGGFALFYRFGLGQINLARQQQDFVSAVSHELKTPLTSICMYSEMLLEGWADEAKKKTYYGFINEESERLSRLISNVLQLARLTRNDPQINLHTVSVGELLDLVTSKISTQVERAGFELELACEAQLQSVQLEVDTDCFTQVLINLVDNALKFSRDAGKKQIDISARVQIDKTVLFTVRDYGPGIPRAQMKRIFSLFYRAENELTRETVGTGIGLALVQQLVVAMRGEVDVSNADPGAEFRLSFPQAPGRAGLQ